MLSSGEATVAKRGGVLAGNMSFRGDVCVVTDELAVCFIVCLGVVMTVE